MSLELTTPTAPLAEAAARVARLLPARSLQPGMATVHLRGGAAGLALSATDGETSVRVLVPATVHVDGEAVVSRHGLADTLAGLDAPEARLAVEGSRLAVRTPGARFALPSLAAARPELPEPPPLAGAIPGAALAAAGAVCGAASRDGALPIFTGVRIVSRDGRLTLVATDRYRMAAAAVPWTPEPGGGDVAALVPAASLAEICRQAARAETLLVYAGGDRFGLSWAGCTVVTASLAGPFPDRQLDQLLAVDPQCTVEADADVLTAAVQRASPYAGPHGRVTVRPGDGALQVCGRDPLHGESEEAVKASVRGDHVTAHYQARYLVDALRPFAGETVRMRIQAGMRATAFSAAGGDLTYLVVPMRAEDA
ncbi:DNA polymerase III subunit beta [Phytohabitans rumicis]|nr:DNA polymerase III subunit beta [Phytohabitans rumicis]